LKGLSCIKLPSSAYETAFYFKMTMAPIIISSIPRAIRTAQQADRLKATPTTQALLRKIGLRRTLETGASKAV
jgi:hypothetical protein